MIDALPPEDRESLSPNESEGDILADYGTRTGIALCLSGGGYRAMLFHLGALWRLNELGYLPRIARVSSVSGGAIVAGVLGFAWPRLAFDQDGVAERFVAEVVEPVRRIAGRTIDVWAVLAGMVGPGTANDYLAGFYRRYLFGHHTLQDLPDDRQGPRFVINAANVQSGRLWRFSRPYMRDYRVGEVKAPKIELAVAVAASSACPPWLSPASLRLDEADFTPNTGDDLQRPPFTTHVVLTDGGVYDNLGLEAAKGSRMILVSDGGALIASQAVPGRNAFSHLYRMYGIVDNQVRSLRKRQLLRSLAAPSRDDDHREGTYWGIGTKISGYDLGDALPCPPEATERLAAVSTRLRRLGPDAQERLINWGYAVCDAAMRRWVDSSLPAPHAFPFPAIGVGGL